MVHWTLRQPPLAFMTTSLPLERFLRTAALLSSDNEHERAVAAKQASSLLAQAGLTWEQVLRAGLPKSNPEARGGSPGAAGPVNSVFEDIFSSFFKAPPAKPSTTAAAAKPTAARWRNSASTILQGEKIPRFIQGRPVIRDRAEYAPGQFKMILGLINDEKDEQYDPLVVFKANTMDLIEEAVKNGAVIGGRVTPSDKPGHLPVFMLTSGF